MESITPDPISEPLAAHEPELDLYSIPTYSSWFLWDEIHETEKLSLQEFFDGSSFSKTPKVYKEYRDFIITKYREDPCRRLTFTEVRKALVGDVSLLHKVFRFLEKWGLINFCAPRGGGLGAVTEGEGEEGYRIRAEEGAPNGIRVVANPNLLKPLSAPVSVGDSGEIGFKMPPLGSYADVFGDLMKQKGLECANCHEQCDSSCYVYTKGSSILCVKCFENGNYGENKTAEDFKFNDCIRNIDTSETTWTEAENLLLLESVMKYGDDWNLVAQNVQTKTKLQCISKLIQMPFGDLMLGSLHGRSATVGASDNKESDKQVQLNSSESQAMIRTENQCQEQTNESKDSGDAEKQGPSLKRKYTASISDTNSSLMKQVFLISAMFGPNITAAAAEAAISALCEENPYVKQLFDRGMGLASNELGSSTHDNEVLQGEDSDMRETPLPSESQETSSEKSVIPLTLRVRAATATALGSAASRAKLLADQEFREMEYLVASIIETQLKKLQCKMRHIEDLDLIMKEEYTRLEEVEESLIAERIEVSHKAFSAGISRWKDHIIKS